MTAFSERLCSAVVSPPTDLLSSAILLHAFRFEFEGYTCSRYNPVFI